MGRHYIFEQIMNVYTIRMFVFFLKMVAVWYFRINTF